MPDYSIEYINKLYNNPTSWNILSYSQPNILIKPTSTIPQSSIDKIKKSIEYFTSKGYSKYVIAGLLGNFKKESEFLDKNISKITSDPKNKANNIGIAQWQGSRFKELKSKFPTSYDTLNSQLEFVHYELQNKVFVGKDPYNNYKLKKWSYNNIKNEIDIPIITHEISVYYEGSSFNSIYLKAQQQRINNALEIYNKFLIQ